MSKTAFGLNYDMRYVSDLKKQQVSSSNFFYYHDIVFCLHQFCVGISTQKVIKN